MTASPYARLFGVLDDIGLRSRSDLRILRANTYAFKWASTLGVMDDGNGWVTEAFTAVWDLHTPVLEHFLATPSPRLFAGRIWSWSYFRPAVSADPVLQRRAAYAAIFPTRTLAISTPIVAWPDKENQECACPVNASSSAAEVLSWGRPFVPYDFLAQAIELRPLLEAGLAYLLPSRFSTEHYGENSGLTQTSCRAESGADVELTKADRGAAEVTASSGAWPLGPPPQVLALPWLHGARLEDTVELAQEHSVEFERYLAALGHIFSTHSMDEIAVCRWVHEVQHHVDVLQARYADKEKELKRKGRDVIAGLCFTAAPLLSPSSIGPLREILAAGLGGSTIKEGIGWLRDWRSRDRTFTDSEFWFAWRLMRTTHGSDSKMRPRRTAV